ncbi:IS1182 family transposase [uncultured Roseobacter sp.]|uniref:IS1182 family transposase n=1 Tax=uncultured Roseobacter sp. TaxID=114847 RepID=UPI002621BA60|nr:IS1182 family transposase [uncultured Roseobacter sp.]
MRTITGTDRSQTLLLPAAIEDYVGPDNTVRFIDAFVDHLDLAELGFGRARPEWTGRPGYHPGDLLKLYIYGYLNRIRSSRRLEAETHRNLEVIWLLRQLRPDFKTIADFRRQNRKAFKQVFREFVVLCRDLDLYGRELIAVDGTRIKAVNSKDRNFTKASLDKLIAQSDERLEKYLSQLDTGDGDEQGAPGASQTDNLEEKIANIRARRDQLRGYQAELKASGEDQISLTDPDARAMARMTKVGVGYNIQIAVDAKHSLIAEQHVTNQVLDYGHLTETAKAAKEILKAETPDIVADRGYFQVEDIEACVKAGMTPYVPKPDRGPAKRDGLFPKEAFTFDAENDRYKCPGGKFLRLRGTGELREGVKRRTYTGYNVCPGCALRPQCTKSKFRQLTRYGDEAELERMAKRVAARPELQDIRRQTVEHPFGTIKQWMNQGAFLMRRLENVRAEFSLTALAYNLRRAITLIGIPGLIAALRG